MLFQLKEDSSEALAPAMASVEQQHPATKSRKQHFMAVVAVLTDPVRISMLAWSVVGRLLGGGRKGNEMKGREYEGTGEDQRTPTKWEAAVAGIC